jgi:two-component system alkaline phosphatase synthesis response regulator PhoP
LLKNVQTLLENQGYAVTTASNGKEALEAAKLEPPDMVVLDINLPDMDGLTVCRQLRSKWAFPILMLTARTDAMDKVLGLELGADDYLTKPFEPIELIARVRAQIRRSQEYGQSSSEKEIIQVGTLKIDREARTVWVGDRPIELTKKEYILITHLADNAGRAISRESLFEQVWEYEIEFGSNSLDVHIYRLRKKIESDPDSPQLIHTVKGFGYKLDWIG